MTFPCRREVARREMVMLKTQGPDCPKCGCNDSQLVQIGSCWGRLFALYECQYCGRRFQHGHVKAKCKNCGSTSIRVASSPRAVNGYKTRYCKCEQCGKRFKIVGL